MLRRGTCALCLLHTDARIEAGPQVSDAWQISRRATMQGVTRRAARERQTWKAKKPLKGPLETRPVLVWSGPPECELLRIAFNCI